MRRKKNLASRLDGASALLLGYLFHENDVHDFARENLSGKIKAFDNNNPVYLEIGCGKGGFAIEHAGKYPEINLIAAEQNANVAVAALETSNPNQENLRFIIGCAEFLLTVLEPHSVARIYLNFSCPFPKKTYANRRLTHPRFLALYRELLTENGEIWQKTDNPEFFEWSLDNFKENGFVITKETRDLHSGGESGHIITEYERNFLAQNKKILQLVANKL